MVMSLRENGTEDNHNNEGLTVDTETQNDIPEEISDMIDQIPNDDVKQQMKMVFSSQFGMMGQISPQMSISKKITSEHVTEYLEIQKIEVQNRYKDNIGKRWFFLAIIVFIIIMLFGTIILLKDSHPEFMEKIITIVISAVLGAAGGFGIGYKKGQGDD